MAESAGLKELYMGYKQQAKFLGHGVGLVVNELPVLCRHSMSCLEKNMVIAAEPKFIVLGVGAVGCENTFVVTEQGLNQLTFGEEKIIEL
jgi:Xaa-Pro aminopeptidase